MKDVWETNPKLLPLAVADARVAAAYGRAARIYFVLGAAVGVLIMVIIA